MKLTLVISSLRAGGAERVMSIMANYWAAQGWKITILTFNNGTETPFYNLDPRVCHMPLAIGGDSTDLLLSIGNNLKRIQVLHQAIIDSNPEAIISFMDRVNILTLLATQGMNLPVVVSERTVIGVYNIGKFWSQLRQWTYPQAEQIVVQTQGAFNYFPPKLQVITSIIPNPVIIPERGKHTITNCLSHPSIIAMGRFSEEKRFDLLLQAFAKLKEHHPQWHLIILGEGQLRKQLESLCDNLGLNARVSLPGRVKNPYEWLKQADLFVMSSRFEGFPNSLCEAMACGLPVIATDCPSGPREIIRHGIDGMLVKNEDMEALASTMDILMSDANERQRLAARAPEVTERFSLTKVMGMWEQVLEKVLP